MPAMNSEQTTMIKRTELLPATCVEAKKKARSSATRECKNASTDGDAVEAKNPRQGGERRGVIMRQYREGTHQDQADGRVCQ
jgi:hypothetical protein